MSKVKLCGVAMLAGWTIMACNTPNQRQGAPAMRTHNATEAKALELGSANTRLDVESRSVFEIVGTKRRVASNEIPDHLVGTFPNPGNPNTIRAQAGQFEMPFQGTKTGAPRSGQGWIFGVALNGVVFDPFAAEFWQGNPQSGWNYDALGSAVALGLDENYAHVQPDGTYHYHGTPTGTLDGSAAQLIGYAADGFPIYYGAVNGQSARSSYRLKAGERPGGSEPDGAYDGAFVEDYEYVAGLGNLDQCNGAEIVSAEYPGGTYAYFVTRDFPAVPRCFMGTPDASFRKMGGGGMAMAGGDRPRPPRPPRPR